MSKAEDTAQITIRLPAAEMEMLQQLAKSEYRSVNEQVRWMLRSELAGAAKDRGANHSRTSPPPNS